MWIPRSRNDGLFISSWSTQFRTSKTRRERRQANRRWVRGIYYWPHATEVRWYPNLLRFLSFASMVLCEFAVDVIWSTATGIAPTSTVLSLYRSRVHQKPQRSERCDLRSSRPRVPRDVIKGVCDKSPRKAIQILHREYDRWVPPEDDAASILKFWSTYATLDQVWYCARFRARMSGVCQGPCVSKYRGDVAVEWSRIDWFQAGSSKLPKSSNCELINDNYSKVFVEGDLDGVRA